MSSIKSSLWKRWSKASRLPKYARGAPRKQVAFGPVDHSPPSKYLESRLVREGPHFKVGQTEVYFPDFTLTLVKQPGLAPNFARFQVPLWFNKLDLRDYLYHAYNVRAFNIRSHVQARPIELLMERAHGLIPRWHRKRQLKFMTVEMDEAFHWPDAPDLDDPATDEHYGFQRALWLETQAADNKRIEAKGTQVPWFDGSDDMLLSQPYKRHSLARDAGMPHTVQEERDAYAAEAEKLLAGREKWQPTWKTVNDIISLTPRDGSSSYKTKQKQ